MISKSVTLSNFSSYKTPSHETGSNPSSPTEHLKVSRLFRQLNCLRLLLLSIFFQMKIGVTFFVQVHQRVAKSRSEPAIPPYVDQRKPEQKLHSSHVVNNSDARKLSVQSSASVTGSSERKPRRSSRTTQGPSLNEVRQMKTAILGPNCFAPFMIR